MNTLSKSFSQFIKAVSQALKKEGFSRKRNTLLVRESSNWALLEFQRSMKSDQDLILFTVNVGIASSRIMRFQGLGETELSWEQCNFRERLGFLMPECSDKWWRISADVSLSELTEEILDDIFGFALPTIREHISDANLRDMWLSGAAPGLTEIERLKYLSVLLKDLGPAPLLSRTIADLKRVSEGKPFEHMVLSHVARLQSD